MKILQTGPHSYVGGVSIHIQRLTSILNNEFIFEFIDESPSNLTPKDRLNIRRLKDQLAIFRIIRKPMMLLSCLFQFSSNAFYNIL